MKLGVLGELLVDVNGTTVGLRRAERRLVAGLAVERPSGVRYDALAEAVWGDRVPASAKHSLQSHVRRIRAVTGDGLVQTVAGGYRLATDVNVDVDSFESAIERAGADDAEAPTRWAEALSWWRGPPFDDLDEWAPAVAERARLTELWNRAVEEHCAAGLTTSDPATVVAEAERLVHAEPLRERRWALLMTALAAAGRRPEALRTFDRARHALATELGISPGVELAQLHAALVRDDAEMIGTVRDVFAHNLPIQLTPLIGRASETADVLAQLADARLVTLTGSAGVGKTRLALAVAAERVNLQPGGVWWVELAPLSDPEAIGRAVLAAIGAHEAPGATAAQQLAVELGDRPSLLVVDNCEHLIDGCAKLVAALLAANPATSVLATSRQPLAVPGEITFQVPSLRCPHPESALDVATLAEYEAVLLFVERAHRARPSFAINEANAAAITQICHRLDGIPLAIELAAGRCGQLSAQRVAAELYDRFRLLTGGARTVMPRQQTLAASIDWSYQRLDATEQATFSRLGVFAGPFPLEAAEAVVAGAGNIDPGDVFNVVSTLVEKNLVTVDDAPHGELRYRLLETLRAFALDRARRAGALNIIRDAHAAWWADWLEPRGAMPTDEVLEEVEGYHDNIKAALDWSADQPHLGLRLLRGVARPWESLGRARDALAAADLLLADDNAQRNAVEWLAAANAASGLYWRARGGHEHASLVERVERVAVQLGDDYHLALARWHKDSASGDSTAEREACCTVRDTARDRGDRFLEAAATIGLASSLAEAEPAAGTSLILEAQALAAASGCRDLRDAARMVHAEAAAARGDLVGSIDAAKGVLQSASSAHLGVGIRVLGFAALLAMDVSALHFAVAVGDRTVRMSPGLAGFAEDARHRLRLLEGHPSVIDLSWRKPIFGQALPTVGFLWLAGREALDAGNADDAVDGVRASARPVPHAQAVLAAVEAAATADETLWHDALAIALDQGLRLIAVDALEGLARTAALDERWAECLRLLGSARRLREQTAYQWRFAFEQQSVNTSRAAAIEALGTEAGAADTEGRGFDWRSAAEFARRAWARGERNRPWS